MRLRVWGTRGSLPTPGRRTANYGGNTSCIELRAQPGSVVALDAGTGIRLLGDSVGEVERIDVLLTHLHMDHIIGLGFFAPLHFPDVEIHVWGPSSTTLDIRGRLSRYLSPPLFPVRLRDLACTLVLHDVPFGTFEIPGLEVTAAPVCHPGPTVGYRLTDGASTVAYLPDHEPALGARAFPDTPRWTSGYDLAAGADLLVHDAQYDEQEYARKIGWGHSAVTHALAFAELCGVGRLVAFHHDPTHDDDWIDRRYEDLGAELDVVAASEGDVFEVPGPSGAAPEGA